ncbi:MAG: DUF5804 family protein [Haloarculaceae archaeon]
MTRVCLVGTEDVTLRYELRTHETAREALATYDLHEPYANSVAVETVSLGAAVSLLNDLNWYLVRYVSASLVREDSISRTEWLSRDLARAVRDDEVPPEETDRFLKVYGVVDPEDGAEEGEATGAPRLVEPMYVTRTGPELPAYDLREVSDTLVVRVTEAEFGA